MTLTNLGITESLGKLLIQETVRSDLYLLCLGTHPAVLDSQQVVKLMFRILGQEC